MSDTQLTAAPEVLQIGGTDVECFPLADGDHDAINNWVRGAYIRNIEATNPSKAVLEAALDRAVTLAYTDKTGSELFGTRPGISYVLHLMTRRKLPVAECAKLLKEPADVNAIVGKFTRDMQAVKN